MKAARRAREPAEKAVPCAGSQLWWLGELNKLPLG